METNKTSGSQPHKSDTVVDGKKQCSNCGQPHPEGLKKCAWCRTVQYCSKDCQNTAWPTHKQSCAITVIGRAVPEDTLAATRGYETDRWLKYWDQMVLAQGMNAMDLETYPDRLGTHVWLLSLSRNKEAKFEAYCLKVSLTSLALLFSPKTHSLVQPGGHLHARASCIYTQARKSQQSVSH
ncbi:hypothetical protein BDV98DRAFT_173786 [Pterulicium gracile]|uniref:MYND-type domain-containing protein n=1 Tax=Pterulicium gracile TaxID=1884261 RepID=A0A5C3QC24_9AGAR|nr:hypothetical protein BDV98DRAFT_173786 [Pterula gracilis]